MEARARTMVLSKGAIGLVSCILGVD